MKQNRLSTNEGEPLNEVAASTVSNGGHVGTVPESQPVGRRRRRRRSVIGPIVATVLITVVAAMSYDGPGGTSHIPAPPVVEHEMTSDEIVADLVNRGLVPAEALEPAARTAEQVTRDLVNRGLIPPQTLVD